MSKKQSKEFKANQGRLARLTKEERTEIARKGGLATQEKARKRKSMADLAKTMLSCDIDKRKKEQIKHEIVGLEDDDISVASLIIYGQIMSAVKGNSKAFELLLGIDEQQKEDETEQDGISKALEEAGAVLWQNHMK